MEATSTGPLQQGLVEMQRVREVVRQQQRWRLRREGLLGEVGRDRELELEEDRGPLDRRGADEFVVEEMIKASQK